MIKTAVNFTIEDPLVQHLSDTAAQRCLRNIHRFGDRRVLIEGGGYEKIWLETQPMGGAMYAKRDLDVAMNNQLMFIEGQREDGRLPGSIACDDGNVIPQFNKFQGFCFPEEALDVWYLTGKDPEFLPLLGQSLERFDDYLWRVRDSDGDGCLESWCRFDTGEDNAVRYSDAPDSWTEEIPPENCLAVPIASMDFMGYSYSSRKAIAYISQLLGDAEKSSRYAALAAEASNKIHDYLWDEEAGALFDRDKYHHRMPVLLHNTLRTMYWGAISPYMASRFVQEHLLNPAEFWTKLPLPSVSISDPLFRAGCINDWSGPCEALTYQRAIRALENYGYYRLIPQLGRRLLQAIGPGAHFVQQYDPFSMEPMIPAGTAEPEQYGPALLSVLEYCSRMYGVHIVRDTLIWSSCGDPVSEGFRNPESSYEQQYADHSYLMVLKGDRGFAYIDGACVFEAPRNVRIETDLQGRILRADSTKDERRPVLHAYR